MSPIEQSQSIDRLQKVENRIAADTTAWYTLSMAEPIDEQVPQEVFLEIFPGALLRKILIENFKSVRHLELELGRINVVIGANGCGKTNILEAICLGGAAAADKLDNEHLAPRGIRYAEPRAMRAGFFKEDLEQPIHLAFTSEKSVRVDLKLGNSPKPFSAFAIEDLSLTHPTLIALLGNDTLALLRSSLMRFENLDTKAFYHRIIAQQYLGSLHSFLIYTPDPNSLRRLEDEARTQPVGIHGDGLFRLLASFNEDQLKAIKHSLQLIDWFDDFEISPATLPGERRLRIKDQFLSDGLVYFEQRAANEGFLFLLFYLCIFSSEYTPSFFAIDNLDNGLNPKLCSHLMREICRLANEHKKQTIITTHNPAVLDGLDLKDEEQRLFVIFRNLDGETCARRILPKDLPPSEPQTRLSEAFLRGYIGGLPKNF